MSTTHAAPRRFLSFTQASLLPFSNCLHNDRLTLARVAYVIFVIISLQPTTLLTFDANGKAWLPYHSSTSAPEFPSQYPLRVVTWNIWEDPRHHHLRHEYIISTLLSNSSGKYNDILCLQEVTTLFFKKLLAHTAVRNDWLITDLEEQFRLCANCYSSVVMIRRKHGDDFKLASAYMEFPNTRDGLRGFIVVPVLPRRSRECEWPCALAISTLMCSFSSELFTASNRTTKTSEKDGNNLRLRLASGRLVDILSENIQLSCYLMRSDCTSVPAILTGDCNVRDYNELNPLITGYHFRDAFRIAHPIFESPFFARPTYGITLTNRRGKHSCSRLDPPNASTTYSFVVWKSKKDLIKQVFLVTSQYVLRKSRGTKRGRMGKFGRQIIWAVGTGVNMSSR